ncbi:glycerophosphoryl diester phosphodiesterase [Kushneria sinocarnis]|uniref:Glycerophosphoryl diester phosphodiesterase n=1 Tax=Kushneria sinocarnis TaxID=595502 RepID=A0A420WVT7_9GAMM|nr:glycerophosphodiester phosphodiesterase family protein [Kushneria sinocarnis]RKR02644.1 glycerophosphoryl diester phosphodiesterase [Kushneria sinocarnis]
MELPRLIAHRGLSHHAPENTLAAIRATHEAGLNWLELDVQCLGDGTPVLWHDAHVVRCSDGQGLLRDYSLAQAKRLDVGRWFDERFAGERMATLEEALALISELGLGLNLELKLSAGHDDNLLAETVVPQAVAMLPRERLLISSFSVATLSRVRELDGNCALGILYEDGPTRGWVTDAEQVEAFSIHSNWQSLDPARAEEIRDRGRRLICYTVNDPRRFHRWWSHGVDTVITDRPELFDGDDFAPSAEPADPA